MNKNRPTLAQIGMMIVFALSSFGTLLFLWIAFGGPVPFKANGYQFKLLLPEATQLATTADVRISGVNVGKVVKLDTSRRNRTEATIELDPKYAPIPRQTKAVLRAKTLLGETFVELAPSRNRPGGDLPEGGELPMSAVSPTVELDEILNALDAKTRSSLQRYAQAGAAGLRGRAADLSVALGELPVLVGEMDKLAGTLDAQQAAVRRTVSGTGRVFDAISARDGELRGLVSSSERVFDAIAGRNGDLAEVFRRLPRFEREIAATLPPFTALARRAAPTLERLQPAADELTPTFNAISQLSPPLRSVMEQLGPIVTASRDGLPALKQILADVPPVLEDLQPFLRTLDPVFRYLGTARREITGFLGNVTAASQGRLTQVGRGSGNVNILRVSQMLSPEGLAFQRRPLGQSRRNAYVAPDGMDKLAGGLESLSTASCGNGDAAPPTATDPEGLIDLIQAYVFRTTGRDVARPACKAQGPLPGYGTAYPHLTADPPVQLKGTR